MDRRDFLKAIGVGAAVAAMPQLANSMAKPVKRPNILFVMADQFRKQAMGFMNEDPVITPVFDRFAKDSMVFTNAVAGNPVCTPFRAQLLTGRFSLSTGVVSNCAPGLSLELKEDEICLGDAWKAGGYQTGYIGKYHLESPSLNKSKNPIDGATTWDAWTPPGPRRHGFDFWYAYNTGSAHFSPHYWTGDSPKKVKIKQWSVEHETDVAIDFIKKRKQDSPFALFISWYPPHPAFIAPEEFKALYKDKKLPDRPNVKLPDDKMQPWLDPWYANFVGDFEEKKLAYFAAISSCDDNFGRLLKTLDAEGIADDTIVVFTSDHGESLGSHGRRAKDIWLEESSGIPFIIRWPEHVVAKREKMPFVSYDVMPTLLGLMGLPVPETVDGTDYSNVMLGKDGPKASSVCITGYPYPLGEGGSEILAVGQNAHPVVTLGLRLAEQGIDWKKWGYRAVRTERYMYVVDRVPGKTKSYSCDYRDFPSTSDPNPKGITTTRFLYDLEKDPYQMNPVIAESADENPIMIELEKELKKWLEKMNDPFPLS